jgi:outer membrane receptor protein involved in Fe transport
MQRTTKTLTSVMSLSFLLSTLSYSDEPQLAAGADTVQTEQPPSLILNVTAKRNKVGILSPISQTEVTREQIKETPRGDQISLPQLLESTTPSVISGGYGRIYTRQDENGLQYQVDGMQLPDLPDNAIGDFFNPRNIEKVEVTLGALPAEFGDRPSGVINIVTPEGSEETTGSVEANYGSYNTFSPEGVVRGSTLDTRLKYYLSLNYHQTDRGLDTPQPESNLQEGTGTSDAVHDASHGNTEFARLDYTLTNSDRLTLLFSNREEFYQIPNFPGSYSPLDPLFGPNGDAYGNDPYNYTPPNTDDSQTETSIFTELVWRHTYSERSFLQVGVFYKYYNLLVQNDPNNDLAALINPSLTNNPDPNNASLYENRHTNSMGVKADYKLRTSDDNLIKAGASVKAYQTAGVATVTGANPFDSGPNILSSTDASPEYGSVEGVYVQDEWKITDKLFINAGLRFDYMQANYSDAQPSFDQFEPRLLVSYMVTPGTKVHGYYGRLFNVPLFEDLHDTFAALAGQAGQTITPYDIKPEKDNYYEAGVDQQIGASNVVSVTAYYKQATDLLDDAQLLNTALQQPFNWAQGYAYGVELALHGKIADHWSDYFNYSYGLAKGNGISGGIFALPEPPTSGYQILDHVQRHTASAGVTYADKNYFGTLIGKYGSGLPTGPNNSENAPGHYSWDTTLGYEVPGKGLMEHVKLSLDVLNIFDNRYAIFIANGFNGSYYAAGREFIGHLSKDFN